MGKKGIQRKIVLCSLMVTLAVSVLPNAWADPAIYTQPALGSGFALWNSYGTQTIAYDDFKFLNGATVTDVHWIGALLPGSSLIINAFTVTFWSDSSDQPGSSLLQQSFSGNANETTDSSNPFLKDYSIDLTTSFSADAGTRYWLSIVADVPWGWSVGTGGNGVSYVDDTLGRHQISGDLAFELSGTVAAVPEPSTMLLLGSGLIGLAGYGGYGRKKFFKK